MSRVMVKSLTAPAKIPLHPLGTGVIAVFAVLAIVMLTWFGSSYSDPYVSAVLSSEGNGERGQAIFRANCAVCHGLEATGNIGPSLLGVHQHKSEIQLIEQVTSGRTPPMPQFQPNPQEMADLLNYLKTL